MLKLIHKDKKIGNTWNYNGIKITHDKDFTNCYFAIKWENEKPVISFDYNKLDNLIYAIDNNIVEWDKRQKINSIKQ